MVILLSLVVFFIAFLATFFSIPFVIRHASRTGHVGIDLHKKGKKEIPELGGISIAFGVVLALLFTIISNSFATLNNIFDTDMNIIYLLAVLSVILMVEIIGFVDDILGLRHRWKFLLPFGIALPLIAVRISALHKFSIPFIGVLNFVNPFIYEFILIPIGVAAATNLTNTFAGFNGLEAGMGATISFFLFILGYLSGNNYVMVMSAILLGSLIAFLKYNFYPARIFPDDVGTLLIGTMIATIVIIGGLEFIGVILMLPYIIDFLFFKIPNRLPSKGWEGKLKGEKLYCESKPIHFAQWIMKKTNGISEKNLVLTFIGIEILLGLFAISIYLLS